MRLFFKKVLDEKHGQSAEENSFQLIKTPDENTSKRDPIQDDDDDFMIPNHNNFNVPFDFKEKQASNPDQLDKLELF